jgi:hypothetical protein
MNDQVGFVTKVFLISLAIALIIKIAALWVSPTSNNPMVLAIVLLPSLVIAIVFAMRGMKVSEELE